MAALEEQVTAYKRVRDAAVKNLTIVILPCCEEAIEKYNARGGVKISLNKDGIDLVSSENKSINLQVKMYSRNGHEFDEWLDSVAELESFTDELRKILQPIFKAKEILLTLGKLVVPPSYYTK